MLLQTSQGQSGSAHVVVLGNEKGGSGKSTTALHVAVALLKAGQRVATIDLDSRQKSFTRYIENRRAWAQRPRVSMATMASVTSEKMYEVRLYISKANTPKIFPGVMPDRPSLPPVHDDSLFASELTS